MSELTCVIGNKNYSSWSLRPWFMLRYFAIDFKEVRIVLSVEGFKEKIAPYSPTSKVPVLIDGEFTIWDSLAICEYVSEKFLKGNGWPLDLQARAHARSISAEMHSGFMNIRTQFPMNCRKVFENFAIKSEVQEEIDRIGSIWKECRNEFAVKGPWLFGEFSVADCMFAPVVIRFNSYQIKLGAESAEYMNTVLSHPAIREWIAAGVKETEVIEQFAL